MGNQKGIAGVAPKAKIMPLQVFKNSTAYTSDIISAYAAGNSYIDINVNEVYPASLALDNIISVASINKSGNLSRFSNYGQNSVDVAAPGEEILSATPGNTYGQSGGTSQAAAFVTGEVALILSKYPQASLSDIKTRIINSCDKLSSLTGKVSGGRYN